MTFRIEFQLSNCVFSYFCKTKIGDTPLLFFLCDFIWPMNVKTKLLNVFYENCICHLDDIYLAYLIFIKEMNFPVSTLFIDRVAFCIHPRNLQFKYTKKNSSRSIHIKTLKNFFFFWIFPVFLTSSYTDSYVSFFILFYFFVVFIIRSMSRVNNSTTTTRNSNKN